MSKSFNLLKGSLSTLTTNTIKNVTVIGAGVIGSGIAQVSAQTGHNTVLVDLTCDNLQKSKKNIALSLQRVAKKLHNSNTEGFNDFIEQVKQRLTTSTNVCEAVQNADLVIEAILENMEAKHKLFRAIDKAAPIKTIFTSSTSSLGIEEIASVTKRADRFGGLHFFHPVPVMRLLEVVRTPSTSEQTFQIMMQWGKTMEKVCIVCKDTPGFVVNRLLIPYIAEAVRMYERGDASASDIDKAMKLGAGYPMGPIELADYMGNDTINSILEGWSKKFPDNSLFIPNQSMNKLVKQGKFGVKTSEGFYKYNK